MGEGVLQGASSRPRARSRPPPRAQAYRRPAEVFDALRAHLTALEPRVGPLATELLRQILGRIVLVTEPGIEFAVGVRGSGQPAWIAKHREHDKWRWLSSLRALKGFNEFEKTLETVYGIHLSSNSVLMGMKKLERSNFAMVGDMVTPGRLYRDKELIGAIGTVIKSCPRGRDVRWTTRDGKTFEEFSRLAMLKGFSSDHNNPICDRCRRGDQNSCQSCRLKREREGGGDAEEPLGKRARKAPSRTQATAAPRDQTKGGRKASKERAAAKRADTAAKAAFPLSDSVPT